MSADHDFAENDRRGIPGCYLWAVWDRSQTAFGDEIEHPDRRSALAAMKAGLPYIHDPAWYTIREWVDDERVIYHYYRPIADGEFRLVRSIPLVSRRLREAEWRVAVRTLGMIALGSLTIVVAALAIADWWGVRLGW